MLPWLRRLPSMLLGPAHQGQGYFSSGFKHRVADEQMSNRTERCVDQLPANTCIGDKN